VEGVCTVVVEVCTTVAKCKKMYVICYKSQTMFPRKKTASVKQGLTIFNGILLAVICRRRLQYTVKQFTYIIIYIKKTFCADF